MALTSSAHCSARSGADPALSQIARAATLMAGRLRGLLLVLLDAEESGVESE